jgi:hypothetical protein
MSKNQMSSEELEDHVGQDSEDKAQESPPSGEPAQSEPDHQTATESETGFLGGRFRTEEELAEYLSVQDSTLKALRARISALEALPQQQKQEQQQDEPSDPRKFFEDPHGEVAKILKKELRDIVAPLIQDVQSRRVRDQWEAVRSKYSNFDTYREAVEETLRAWNIAPEYQTAELIERVFLSEVGKSVLESKQPERKSGIRINPQLRPSSHPTKKEEGKPKIKLTEEERRLARIQFKGVVDKDGKPVDPEEEYIKWALSEDHDQRFVLEDA